MLNIVCQCGRHLKVPESAIGQAGRCPFCRSSLRLVAPDYEQGGANFTDRLVIATGPAHLGEQFLLGGPGPIEIGKLPGKPILLAGNKVSRSHCRLLRFNNRWLIEDQGSKNGTLVNGQPITRQRLSDGDTIQVGEFLLQFISGSADQPPDGPSQDAESRTLGSGQAATGGTSVAAPPVSQTQESTEPQDADASEALPEDLYPLGPSELIDPPRPDPPPPPAPPPADGPVCPGCRRQLPRTARICVDCGINLTTGKPLLTASEENLDEIYSTVESIVRVVSWMLPFGMYPMASDALGVRRPYVTWGITAITILISMGVIIAQHKKPERDQTLKQYMLWCGSMEGVTADDIEMMYLNTWYGDENAYRAKVMEIEAGIPEEARENISDDEIALEALRQLPLQDRCYGRYEPYQLLTSAFLHADLMHLVGNMIFLLVIGGRVNAMVGNLAMILLYPLLAAAAGYIHMISAAGEPPCPLIGASGAIMGLAGMYFILMPVNHVHMVIWLRPVLLLLYSLFLFLWCPGILLLAVVALVRWGLKLFMKMWAARGFWVLLFYMSFDVIYTIFGIEDEVAHWAHLGGFLVGMGIALLLLTTRLVNARGGDLLNALLGRRIWWLIGKPEMTRPSPIAIF